MATAQELLKELEDSFILLSDKRLTYKSLIYGVSGVGKTKEAMEEAQIVTPEDKEILFLDTSDGWVSLLNHPHLCRRTRPMAYKGLSQLTTLVDALEAGAGSFASVGTVVFDEISSAAKRDFVNVMDGTGLGEFDAPEFKHFNIATRRLEKVLDQILRLRESHNLIFVSHMKERKDERTKIVTKAPSIMPAFAETVKESLHLVTFMQADIKHSNTETGPASYYWSMQVHPSKMVTAKTRIGGLNVVVTPEQLHERLRTWITREDITFSDVTEIVELPEEKLIPGELVEDQKVFTGFEIES